MLSNLTKDPGYQIYLKANIKLNGNDRCIDSISKNQIDCTKKNTDIPNGELAFEASHSSKDPDKADLERLPRAGKKDKRTPPEAQKHDIGDSNLKPYSELLRNVDILMPLLVIFLVNVVYAQSPGGGGTRFRNNGMCRAKSAF